MKTLSLIACLLSTVLLAACVTQAPVQTDKSQDGPSLTAQYMYLTERQAQERMVTIYWVHPPKSEELAKASSDRDN